MKINIGVEYRTNGDESLNLVLPNNDRLPMKSQNGVWWSVVVDSKQIISNYHFELCKGVNVLRVEECRRGRTELKTDAQNIDIIDFWHDKDRDADLMQKPLFRDIICCHKSNKKPLLNSAETYFEIVVSAVKHNQSVALLGSTRSFGNWKAEQALPLQYVGDSTWVTTLKNGLIENNTEYKVVILEKCDSATICKYEQGDNRIIDSSDKTRVIRFKFRGDKTKVLGTAVPLFSLRSPKDWGIGEFADLINLGKWCVSQNQNIIQILPINDTTISHTWRDSYPYNCASSMAINPIYLSVTKVGRLKDKVQMNQYIKRAQQLNRLQSVDYESVAKLKEEYLRKIYRQDIAQQSITKEYKEFVNKNISWLLPYAVWNILRDQYATADWNKWGENSIYSVKLCENILKKKSEEVEYYYFIQFHIDKQLKDVSKKLHQLHIGLKGDIPIGICRNSVDTWVNPTLFNLTSSTGAPPDAFSTTGQNWGFPTYNWEQMEKNNYEWWRARFAKMADYFDAYRIDHILGFFRIWEVPVGAVNALLGEFNPSLPYTADQIKSAGIEFNPRKDVARSYNTDNVLWLPYRHIKGCYYPRIAPWDTPKFKALPISQQQLYTQLHNDFYYHRHEEFWKQTAIKRLSAIVGATNMVVCGEDLGMIPACVAEVMDKLQILSLEIERMPKKFGETIADVSQYPYWSVCTTSTHDMNPIRAWWEEDKQISEYYYKNILGNKDSTPIVASARVCMEIVQRNINSASLLTILPLQDWLSFDSIWRKASADPTKERINVPSNSNQYWQYRIPIVI